MALASLGAVALLEMKEGTPLGARAQSAIRRAAVLYKPRLATFNFNLLYEQHWSLLEDKRLYSLTASVRNIFTFHVHNRINNVCILINFDKQTLITDAGNFQKD
jgi:hypothetical protein